ncbi:hypothetical protein SBRY_60554 [Actinacidiphila bryophytorum]|uniref:Uncharacterized protein n=1 Tax=Actinacidiphila bryophytorum TaxID=1436133 RepID=A0A9W4H6T7_9ACTN|nr:hypothetical protein SBRY_60554 [Actinacidiphila bryophytorum]
MLLLRGLGPDRGPPGRLHLAGPARPRLGRPGRLALRRRIRRRDGGARRAGRLARRPAALTPRTDPAPAPPDLPAPLTADLPAVTAEPPVRVRSTCD